MVALLQRNLAQNDDKNRVNDWGQIFHDLNQKFPA